MMTRSIMAMMGLLISTTSFAIGNPSMSYCLKNGGSYETRKDKDGAEDGVCMFSEGGTASECGGWAFLRRECFPGECERWSVDTHSCEEVSE